MTLLNKYKILNVVDSLETFNNLTNKNLKSLYLVQTPDGYLLYKGDKPIITNIDPASNTKAGLIKASDYINIRKDGSIIINKANKLSRRIKLGNAYFDGTKSISLKELGAASSVELKTAIDNLNEKYDQLFQSASDGKTKIADAITGKGITTSAEDTFDIMATNIGSIETGIDTTDATALPEDIVAGKTAYVNDNKITGTVPKYENTIVATNNTIRNYTLVLSLKSSPAYIGNNVEFTATDIKFQKYNIVSEASIFGLYGTAPRVETRTLVFNGTEVKNSTINFWGINPSIALFIFKNNEGNVVASTMVIVKNNMPSYLTSSDLKIGTNNYIKIQTSSDFNYRIFDVTFSTDAYYANTVGTMHIILVGDSVNTPLI